MPNIWYATLLVILSGFMAYMGYDLLGDGKKGLGILFIMVTSLLMLLAVKEYYNCWNFNKMYTEYMSERYEKQASKDL